MADLEHLPPIILTLTCSILVLGFQGAGTVLLYPATSQLVRRPVHRFTLAWLATPVLTGALAAARLLLWDAPAGNGMVWATALLAIAALVYGLWRRSRISQVLSWLAALFRRSWRQSSPVVRILIGLGLVAQVLFLLRAGHPQKLYDQLDYHLMVPRLLAGGASAVGESLDPHVLMTGLLEYGAAWPAALMPTVLGQIAVYQLMTWAVTMPVILLVLLRRSRDPLVFALALIALPILVMDRGVDFRVGKPDAVLLAVAVVLASLAVDEEDPWPASLGLLTLALATKLTAVTIAMAWVPTLWWWRGRPGLFTSRAAFVRTVQACLPGAGAFGVFLAKNGLWLGNPFYPAFAAAFPSSLADQAAALYWRLNGSTDGLTYGRRALGMLALAWHSPPLLVAAAASIAGTTPSRVAHSRQALAALAIYYILFCLSSGLFFGPEIYPRFLYAGLSPLILLPTLLLGPERRGRFVTFALVLLALAQPGALSLSGNLIRWNRQDTIAHMTEQEGFYGAARDLAGAFPASDRVLTLRESFRALFMQEVVLFEHAPSVRERAISAGFVSDPVATARREHLRAVVFHDTERALFDRLVTGRGLFCELEWRYGSTTACVSHCGFAQKVCERSSGSR